MSGKRKLTLEQGATWSRVLTWEIPRGVPVDLSNYSARMQIRETYESSTPLLSLTTAVGGGITLGGAAGTITIVVSAAITATLLPGNHVYDIELVSAGGVVTRLLEGQMTITPEVTR